MILTYEDINEIKRTEEAIADVYNNWSNTQESLQTICRAFTHTSSLIKECPSDELYTGLMEIINIFWAKMEQHEYS